MSFVLGFLTAMALVVSIPGIAGTVKNRDLIMTNWRLARTCAVAMILLFAGFLFAFNQIETFTDMNRLMIFLGALAFSIPLGVYFNTWSDHNWSDYHAEDI